MLGAITCLFLTLPFALACGPLMREDCSHDVCIPSVHNCHDSSGQSSYQYDYFEEVQGELAQLEKAMQVERSGKGLEPVRRSLQLSIPRLSIAYPYKGIYGAWNWLC